MPARSLAPRLDALLDHLAEVPGAHDHVVVGAHEEPGEGVALAQAALLDLDRGHDQEGPVGIPGEDVADARAAGAQEALAVADAALDLGGILGVVGHQEAPRLLLPPAEVGDAVVVAVQDARLAGRGRGGQQGLPVTQLVAAAAKPPGHLRHPAGAHRVAHDVVREAVELDDDEPWRIGPGDVRLAAGHRPHERGVVRVVLTEPEERRDARLKEAEDEGHDQQADEPGAHRDITDERVEQPEDEDLEQQGQQDERHHRPAGHEPDEDGPHEQVEGRDQDDGGDAARQARHLQLAGQQPGREIEGDERRQERHEPPLDEGPAARPPSPEQLELGPIELDDPPDHEVATPRCRRPAVDLLEAHHDMWAPSGLGWIRARQRGRGTSHASDHHHRPAPGSRSGRDPRPPMGISPSARPWPR